MKSFYNEYKDDLEFVQLVAQIPWKHNIILMQKIKDANVNMGLVKKNIELTSCIPLISQSSNKNTGYRARLYSKKLVAILNGRNFNQAELLYLDGCIKYWINWQEASDQINKELIMKEYIRNGNRFLIDVLSAEGYTNLTGLNINNTREEFIKRLKSSGVEEEKILKLVRDR